jgi:hypothetical protein
VTGLVLTIAGSGYAPAIRTVSADPQRGSGLGGLGAATRGAVAAAA